MKTDDLRYGTKQVCELEDWHECDIQSKRHLPL